MAVWQAASAAFFAYVAVVAVLLPRLPAGRRRLAWAGAFAGGVTVTGSWLSPHAVLDDWVMPPVLLLLAYWTSGLLFVAPMPRVERAFLDFDASLRVRPLAAALPRALAEFLEISYMSVYPIVPAALVLHLTRTAEPDAARFWAVILVTDFVCFGMLPWVQTRPPRALEPPPWSAKFRSLNLRLLGGASIQANTFPSGHAAEALAAALMVTGAGPITTAILFLMALSISAGAVLGRYHFAADALTGWAVAAIVWALM